jgi:hypothetical protein
MRRSGLVSTHRRLPRRLRGPAALGAALAAAACLAGLGPAVAASAQGAAGHQAGGPPPPGGGTYAHTIYSKIDINGSGPGGGSVDTGQYQGPACWLEPRFTGAQSWQKGDPQQPYNDSSDADTYWWWFATLEPGFPGGGLAHAPGGHKLVNDSFRKVQGNPGWWWVPSWLDTPGGLSCALQEVGSLGLNNGFLQLAPPSNSTSNAPGHIDGEILARMARAALRLPTISVQTSPPAARNDVNLPMYVAVSYNGNPHPSDTASVRTPGGVLSATVTATRPTVTLSAGASSGQVRLYDRCGARGSRYTGNPRARPSCGVTFFAPSAGHPYLLTVTATWTVTWSDSQGNRGTFVTPPARRSVLVPVTVREIQSINGSGGH